MNMTLAIINDNGGAYLRRYIDSLEAWRHLFDIVLIDNCSRDDSLLQARELGISTIISFDTKQPRAVLLNAAADVAQHPYILFTHSDIIFNEGFFEHLQESLVGQNSVAFMNFQVRYLDKSIVGLDQLCWNPGSDGSDWYYQSLWAIPPENYQTALGCSPSCFLIEKNLIKSERMNEQYCSDICVHEMVFKLQASGTPALFNEYASIDHYFLERHTEQESWKQDIPFFFKNNAAALQPVEEQRKEMHEPGMASTTEEPDPASVAFRELLRTIQNPAGNETIETIKSFVREFPEHAPAYHMLGMLYYKQTDRVRALMHYERAVSLDPNFVPALKSLADLYYVEMERVEEAQMLYARIVALQPEDRESLQIVANICLSRKQLHAASILYEKILCSMAENSDAQNALAAIIRYRQNNGVQESAEQWHKEALVLIAAGMIPEAIYSLEQLLQFHPRYALAHNDLGVLYQSNNDLSSSKNHYEKAMALDPDNLTYKKNYADTFLLLKQYDKAVREYQNILDRNAHDIDALYGLAQIGIETKQFASARRYLKNILEIDPKNKIARMSLATIEKKKGKNPDPFSCCICNGQKYTETCKVGDYSLVSCIVCGMVSVYPMPYQNEEEERQHYEGDVFEYMKKVTEPVNRPQKISPAQTTLRNIKKIVTGINKQLSHGLSSAWIQKNLATFGCFKGRILDVGCGTGNLLYEMREKGTWQGYGLEVSPVYTEHIKKQSGINIMQGTLAEAHYPSDFFDVITMIHVMEHIPSPMDTLQETIRILKKNGLAVIAVPNIKSLVARITREQWDWVAPETHLHYFSPQTLEIALKQAGFETLLVTTRSGNPEHVKNILLRFFMRQGISADNFIIKGFLAGVRMAARGIDLVIGPLLNRLNLGEQAIVIARKPEKAVVVTSQKLPIKQALQEKPDEIPQPVSLPADDSIHVLLLQMPCWGIKSPPFALACLSGYLKDKGIRVTQRDLNIDMYHHFKGTNYEKLWTLNEGFWGDIERVKKFSVEHASYLTQLVDEILAQKPDLVGFSILWSTEQMSRILAQQIKKRAPQVKIVFGGPHCARQMQGTEMASAPYIDFVVHGEGEITLYELANALAHGKDTTSIQGVISKQAGKIVYAGDRPLVKNLDEFPSADFTGFDFSRYPGVMIPASTSRGCPNRCIYCDEKIFWHVFRTRSAQQIFDEVSLQYKKYGIQKFEFVDSLVNGNVRVLEEFCDLVIREKLPIQWMGQAAVRKEMTRELLGKIKQSGCFHLCFGIEHANTALMERMGKSMCKGTDVDQLVRNAHDVGLGIGLNWMFGFPGETDQDFQQDLDFFTRNSQYLQRSIVNNSPGFCGFTPGCYAYTHPDEFEIILGQDACMWKSKDGKNTYLTRLRKFQIMAKHLAKLNIRTGFPTFKNEAELIGNYYFQEHQYELAATYLMASLVNEGMTVEKFLKACDAFHRSENTGKIAPIYRDFLANATLDDEQRRKLDEAMRQYLTSQNPSEDSYSIGQPPVESNHAQAIRLAHAGQVPEAIELLKRHVQSQPESALALNDLGVLYSMTGDFETALKHQEQAALLDPWNTTFAKNLADLYFVAGYREKAEALYQDILLQTPHDTEALLGLGKVKIEEGNREAAIRLLKRIEEIDPNNQTAKQQLEELTHQEQKPLPTNGGGNGSKPAQPVACNSSSSPNPTGMSDRDVLLQEYQKALTLFTSVAKRQDTSLTDIAYDQIQKEIQPYISKGTFGKAVQHCLHKFGHDVHDQRLLLLLGRLYHRAGLVVQAIKFFERSGTGKNPAMLRRIDLFKQVINVLPNSRTDIENFCDPDVILIQAPGWGVNTPPLGTAMLASYARNKGYKVLPIDLNVEFYLGRTPEFQNTWELDQSLWFWNTKECVERMLGVFQSKIDAFIDMILATNANVIGFTLYNSSELASLELARILKQRQPELTVIFGGPHASRFAAGPRLVMDPAVDAVAQGEGELTLIDILERVKNNRSLTDCPGLLLKGEKEPVNTGERELIMQLDQLPAPDFSDYAFEHYKIPTRLPLSSSRGCPNHCIFCNERPFWKQYRHRSADKVFAEIKAQIERHPFVNFLDFQDSLVNGKLDELEKLADLIIRNKLNIQWAGQAAIRKDMSPELMTKLKQSGCVCLAYGLETSSAPLMLKVGKVLSRGADANVIAERHGKTGLGVTYNIMFGLPGETEEDAFETLEFLRRNAHNGIAVNPSPSFCGFGPGSLVYEDPAKYGVDLTKGGLYWESMDGKNTYPIRLKRFEDFCRLVKELGVSTTYPSPFLLDRNRSLGNYYAQTGNTDRACYYYQAWLAEHPDDKDIRNRLNAIAPPPPIETQDIQPPVQAESFPKITAAHTQKSIICLNPFYEFEIDITGRVVVCCTAWLKQSLGNMKKQTIAEVWNSQIARYIRRKMYKGEWEDICNPCCPKIVAYRKFGTAIPYSELSTNKYLTPKHVEEILAGKDYLESTPTVFKLSDSKICNLTCKMCGVVRSPDLVDDQVMIEKRTKDLIPYLAKAKIILMCGNGDPFARKDTRELLINYKSANPDLKFSLITNGLLLPKYWDRVKHQHFDSIDISVDAACKETYEKIRIGGTWEELLNVLDLVRDNKNHFGNVLISMVVMKSNYRQIPAFNDLAESYGFIPMYSRIQGIFEDENIFAINDQNALQKLRMIVTEEHRKKRTVPVIWQDLLEFAVLNSEEAACLTHS
ncbi:MAG: radical SAM protein [Nitrospirota bacterium]